jgi:hypothetical protein
VREFGGLLEEPKEDPGAKKRRRLLFLAVAVVILVGVPTWAYYHWFYIPERRAVTHFFALLTSGDTQGAYAVWQADPAHYAYKDFLEDWGPAGEYGPVKSYRIEEASSPSSSIGSTSGVIVTVEVSPYQPFPETNDVEKSSKSKQIQMWVEKRDNSLGFAPSF